MKSRFYVFFFIGFLLVVLLGAIGLGLYITNKISNTSEQLNQLESNEPADYHIMIIVDSKNRFYSTQFRQGIKAAALEYKIAYEIIEVEGSNYYEDVLDALDMAIYSKVDGIVLHAIPSDKVVAKINDASDLNIPVITLNEDLAESARICYVGVNRYNIGQEAGKILAESMGGKGKIAVVEQRGYLAQNYLDNKIKDSINTNQDNQLLSKDTLLLGIADIVKNYKDLKVDFIGYTEQGTLSAETIITNILKENPDITGIFCSDGQNTLGVIQAIIDNNLVNKTKLIGYGDEEEILEYVEKGNIIEATLVSDYHDIGYEAMKAFYEYKNVQFVSSYINTDLKIVTENNIDAYRNEKSEIREKEE